MADDVKSSAGDYSREFTQLTRHDIFYYHIYFLDFYY